MTWLLVSRASVAFALARLPPRCPLLRRPPPPLPVPLPLCPRPPSPLGDDDGDDDGEDDDELPFSDSLSALDEDELPDPPASWLSALSSEDDDDPPTNMSVSTRAICLASPYFTW